MRFIRVLRLRWICAVALLAVHATSAGTEPTVVPLPVGFLVPLTGDFAEFGVAELRAAELAVEDFNRNGGVDGRPVQLVVHDTRHDPGLAGTRFRELLAGGVRFFFVASSGAALVVGPMARDAQALVITDAASPRLHQDNPRALRTCPSADSESQAIVKFARNSLAARRFALLHMDNAYGEGYREPFSRQVSASGGLNTAIAAYGEKPERRNEAVATVLASEPEVLFVVGFGPPLATIIAEARAHGFRGAVFAAASIAYANTRSGASDAIDGTYFPDVPFTRVTWNPLAAALADRYRTRWHSEPPALAAMTYDAMHLVFEGLVAAGPEPQAVTDWLGRRGGFTGAAGAGRVTTERDVVYDLAILRLDQGAVKVVPDS